MPKITIGIEGRVPVDAKDRILAIVAATKAICQSAGEDAADGVMVLLTAAVHLTRQQARLGADLDDVLAGALGSAMVAEEGFFKLREVPRCPQQEAK